MAKTKGKHQYHREDMNKLNRTALLIGGSVAVVILVVMIFSFVF